MKIICLLVRRQNISMLSIYLQYIKQCTEMLILGSRPMQAKAFADKRHLQK